MRKIVLIALLVGGAAIALLLAPRPPHQAAPDEAAGEAGALMAAPAPQATERIKVTARGQNIKAAAWEHSSDNQRPIAAPGLIRDAATFPGKIGIEVGGPQGLSTVAIDSTAAHEGNLYRIHVDRPGNSQQLIVLGFYDALDSDAAYEDQAYGCKKCPGNVTVCGVNPECF